MKKLIRSVIFLSFIGLFLYPGSAWISRKIFIFFDPLHQLVQLRHLSEGILVIPLYLLLLKLFNNFFCRDICPLGYIFETLPSFKFKQSTTIKLGGYLFFGILFLSFFSLNISFWFDPFVFFTQLCSIFTSTTIPSTLFVLIPVGLIILLNFLEKRWWCKRLCPVGYCLNKSTLLLKKNKKSNLDKLPHQVITRRNLLIAGSLLSLKAVYPKVSFATKTKRILRPPGALPEHQFLQACLKCASCIGICPTGVLQPALLESGLSGLSTPLFNLQKGFCEQNCNRCGQACPVEAIKPLSLSQKQVTRIGQAKVNKQTCLCHAHSILCLICHESCPYHAIETIKNKNGVPSPIVNKNKCVGCGKCENKCPLKNDPAIAVGNI